MSVWSVGLGEQRHFLESGWRKCPGQGWSKRKLSSDYFLLLCEMDPGIAEWGHIGSRQGLGV